MDEGSVYAVVRITRGNRPIFQHKAEIRKPEDIARAVYEAVHACQRQEPWVDLLDDRIQVEVDVDRRTATA